MIISNGAYSGYLAMFSKASNDDNINNDTQSKSDVSALIPANMDSVDISLANVTEETEAEIIEKPKFDWKYNTTGNGYLPDFKLGNWENTSDILFGGNTITQDDRLYAVYLPETLQEKMEADPDFAEEINSKLEDFFNLAKRESGILDDGTEYFVIAQQMAVAMDENGNIMHSYIRTESYSVNNAIEVANDENIPDDLDDKVNSSKYSGSLTVRYGFAAYQSIGQIGLANDNELTGKEKNANALAMVGVQFVITMETTQMQGSEPEIEIRKANGDIVELETGKLILKRAGYGDNLQKYDTKA